MQNIIQVLWTLFKWLQQ